MKPAAIMGMLFLLLCGTASAQLTLLPQLGFDRANTKISYNDITSFSSADAWGAFKASLRLDYRFKGGHGAYAGFGTRPGVQEIIFANPTSASSNFKTNTAATRWGLEAGYLFSSKPINLGKGSKTPSSPTAQRTEEKKQCGTYSRSHCGSQKETRMAKKSPTMNMRLQPSVGLAYIPSIPNDLEMEGAAYKYNAGNWETAVTGGMGFEFGKGRQRLFTVNVSYAYGLGNQDAKTLTTLENSKTVENQFRSQTSTWGLSLGVPISLTGNKKPAAKKPASQQRVKKDCSSYRSRCVLKI